jgi:hypothetical protein
MYQISCNNFCHNVKKNFKKKTQLKYVQHKRFQIAYMVVKFGSKGGEIDLICDSEGGTSEARQQFAVAVSLWICIQEIRVPVLY